MERIGTDGDSPKERQLYPPLLLPWPARFKAPQSTSHCAAINACCDYRQSWFGSAGRGWETRIGATRATNTLTLFF